MQVLHDASEELGGLVLEMSRSDASAADRCLLQSRFGHGQRDGRDVQREHRTGGGCEDLRGCGSFLELPVHRRRRRHDEADVVLLSSVGLERGGSRRRHDYYRRDGNIQRRGHRHVHGRGDGGANANSSAKDITTAKVKVTLNGKTGTASAMVKQEANVVESSRTNWGAAYVNVQSTEFDSSGGTASVTVEPVEGKKSEHTPPGRRLTWGERYGQRLYLGTVWRRKRVPRREYRNHQPMGRRQRR